MNSWIFSMVWMCTRFVLWFLAFTPSERVALVAAFLVLVGVIGEYIIEVEAIEERKLLKKRLKWLSMGLLLMGLSGDVLGVVMGRAETVTLTQEVDNAKAAADGAVADFQQANGELDLFDKRTTKISSRLDVASNRLGDLEEAVKLQGPRWKVLEANKDKFINALKPFPDQKIILLSCDEPATEPPEEYRLSQDLAALLNPKQDAKPRGAGWKLDMRTWDNCPVQGGTSYGGNVINVSTAATRKVKDAAQALINILNGMEIATFSAECGPEEAGPNSLTMRFEGPNSPRALAARNPDSIVLLVGQNPSLKMMRWPKSGTTLP